MILTSHFPPVPENQDEFKAQHTIQLSTYIVQTPGKKVAYGSAGSTTRCAYNAPPLLHYMQNRKKK